MEREVHDGGAVTSEDGDGVWWWWRSLLAHSSLSKSATKTRPSTAPALSRLGRTSSPLLFRRFELEGSSHGPNRPTSIRAVTGGLPMPATFPELKKPGRPKNDWRNIGAKHQILFH